MNESGGTAVRHDKELRLAVDHFEPLVLGEDDHLPVAIELLLGYRCDIAPTRLLDCLRCGLVAFPQLAGTIEGEWGDGTRVVTWHPAGGVVVELAEDRLEPDAFADWQVAPAVCLRERFMPRMLWSGESAPMLALRLTRCPATAMSVIGVIVSHEVVDGAGLAWFLAHCTAALHGRVVPSLVHRREVIGVLARGGGRAGGITLPPGYAVAGDVMGLEHDGLAGLGRPVCFGVPIDDVVLRRTGASGVRDLRFRLAARLAALAARLDPALRELAVWCDPRGCGSVPASFTGNAGCYVHLPLAADGAGELERDLKSLVTRAGFVRINRTWTHIGDARAAGVKVIWKGSDPTAASRMLQLNLLSQPARVADFGGGPPAAGVLLARNSPGLRISHAPDGGSLWVEACLPGQLGEALRESWREGGW